MHPRLLLNTTIRPTLALLAPSLGSLSAQAFLLAIAAQESGILERFQEVETPRKRWWEQTRLGPAHGFWGFERAGGVAGVLRHPKAREIAAPVLAALEYPEDARIVHDAIAHNDVLACALARALIYTIPEPLPGEHAAEEARRQYLWAWRPGKPREATWADHYHMAWATVNGHG